MPFGDDTLLGSLPDSCSEEVDFCSTYSYEEGDVLSYDGDEYGNVLRREELIGLDILISPTGSTPVWRAIPYDCDLWTRENAGETFEKEATLISFSRTEALPDDEKTIKKTIYGQCEFA